jgi:5-methylcytosine-specific restriction endonuclease McrA
MDGTMAAKKCSKCGVEKPLDQFYKQSGCKDGRRPDCKACFYVACKARLKPGQRAEYNRRRRAKFPNKDREYYEKNKHILIPKMVEYNRRNRDAYLAKMRAWRKANPEKVQVWVRNRRAKLKGLVGSHTIQDINALITAQNGRCVYCRCDIRSAFQVDHIMPVSKGGSNDKSNLQLLCKACNLDKRDKDPAEYLKTRSLNQEDAENGRCRREPEGLVSNGGEQ